MRLMLCILLFSCFHPGLFAQDDPRDMLKSRDARTRLRGLDLLEEGEDKDAEKLLRKAAQDDDWEIAERAVEALHFKGSIAAVSDLVGLALAHPLTVIREKAADAAAKIDPDATRALLLKKARGKNSLHALQALTRVGATDSKKVRKLLSSEERFIAAAAAEALAAAGSKEDESKLAQYLKRGTVRFRLAVFRGMARRKDASVLPVLLQTLGRERRPVLQRRYIRIIRDHVRRLPADGDRRPALARCRETLLAATDSNGPVFIDLLHSLARGKDPVGDPKKLRKIIAEDALSHDSELVRAAAARVLGELRDPESFADLKRVALEDKKALVRFQALTGAMNVEGDHSALLASVLEKEKNEEVLEEALAQFGKSKITGGLAGPRKFLKHENWRFVLAAAVSLGRLRDSDSIPDLNACLTHDDWRVRGAGAAGLAAMRRKASFEGLIKALEDKDPYVVNTAQDGLVRLTGAKIEPRAAKWKRWWKANADSVKEPAGAVARNRTAGDDKYADGFRERPYDALSDVLVVVLTAPRDQLEKTLDDLKIERVLTRKGEVINSGLHPRAVFFANCPGAIDAEDAARLEWFVRAGGSMFTTCVALSNTASRVFPGMMRAAGGAGGAAGLDADAVEETEEFVRGVFDDHARPRYEMAGNQVIQAVRRERVRTVLDSIDACEAWGAGDLAAFFRIGHGLVMDSANHFALQGMGRARLKTADDRKAFALERLGMSYSDVRTLDKKGVFKSHTKATKACPDHTVMRLAARFVFARRRLGF